MSRKRSKYVHDPHCLSLTHDGDCNCAPRQLRKPPFTLPQLEALMASTFGEDWKNLVIVGPFGDPIRLRDIPEECGFHPKPTEPMDRGLWQINDRPVAFKRATDVEEMFKPFKSDSYKMWLNHLTKISEKDIEDAEYISDECISNNHVKCGDDGVCACECHSEEW